MQPALPAWMCHPTSKAVPGKGLALFWMVLHSKRLQEASGSLVPPYYHRGRVSKGKQARETLFLRNAHLVLSSSDHLSTIICC